MNQLFETRVRAARGCGSLAFLALAIRKAAAWDGPIRSSSAPPRWQWCSPLFARRSKVLGVRTTVVAPPAPASPSPSPA
jgi:hypothetical protein